MLENKDFDPRKTIFNLNKFTLKREDDLKDLTRKIFFFFFLKAFFALFLWRRTPEKTDLLRKLLGMMCNLTCTINTFEMFCFCFFKMK